LWAGIEEGKRGKWGLEPVPVNDPDPEASIEGPAVVILDRRGSDGGGDGDLDFELGLGRENESGRPDLVEGGVITEEAPD
jgi:hypothetical protein